MPPRTPLQQRLRTASRIALYGSLLLTVGLGASFVPVTRNAMRAPLGVEWAAVDWSSVPEVQHLQAYLQVDTSPDGSEIAGARFLAEILEGAGIPATIEELGDRGANLWAVLEGASSEALVLHNHIDVEPIFEPEHWKYPPFGGTVEPPWIFGRGAFDMKSVTIAQLEAFLEVKRRMDETGRRPSRSIVFLATGGEETGSDLGTRWVLWQHRDLTQRFWAVLGEGGVLETTDRTTIKYWGTSIAQKQFVHVVACSPSRARLEDLLEDLFELERNRYDVRRTEAVDHFLEGYAPTRENPLFRDAIARLQRTGLDAWALDRLPPYLRALFRNEAHPFPIEPMPGGGGYRLIISLHLLPGSDLETEIPKLLPPWLTHGVALAVRVGPPSIASTEEHPAFRALDAAIRARHGEIEHGPHFLSFYANDGRFFREAGVPYYGFTPFLFMSSDSTTISGPNERVSLPEFVEGVALYRDATLKLLDMEPSG